MNQDQQQKKGALLPAVFVSRPNRFLAEVCLAGEEVAAHIADPGRLEELLVPGRRVYLRKAGTEGGSAGSARRTAFDLVLVEHEGILVSVDSGLPNRLVAAALSAGFFPELAGYPTLRAEVPLGKSRIDFLLSGSAGDCWLEVKSVTLVQKGVALFPDAPTTRGARHLEELLQARRSGKRAVVLFIVQRPDATLFVPNAATDPHFAASLLRAARGGVEVLAYTCRVELGGIALEQRIPVEIRGP